MGERRDNRLMVISVLLTLISAAVIVCFSGQDSGQSNTLSRALVVWILERLSWEGTPEELEALNLVLRKLAHFSLYFLLGLGLTGALPKGKKFPAGLAAVLLGVLFAAGDEFHQRFSQGRTPSGWDVLLDACGVFAGQAVSAGLRRLREKRK